MTRYHTVLIWIAVLMIRFGEHVLCHSCCDLYLISLLTSLLSNVSLPISDNYESLSSYAPDECDESGIDQNKCERSLETLFESLMTPSKEGKRDELSRFDNNTFSYLSPSSKKLQSDIALYTGRTQSHRFGGTISESRKSMISNIDYMIEYGSLDTNSEAAAIFDEMEKSIQLYKRRLQGLILPTVLKGGKQGSIEFASFDGKKTKPQPRLKGLAG